jgi:hypothetical protein
MKYIARIWLFMWLSGVLVMALIGAGGCTLTVIEPPKQAMATDKACPRGLTHDECVTFKFCSKHPGICAAR